MMMYMVSMKFRNIGRIVKVGKFYYIGKMDSKPGNLLEWFTTVWTCDYCTICSKAWVIDAPGWKHFKVYVRNQKKMNIMLKQAKLYSRRIAPKFNFLVEVPRNWNDAEFGQWKQNSLWKQATDPA